MKQADKKMPRRAIVARCMRNILRPNTTRRAKVAEQVENVAGRNCTMAVIERATQRVEPLRKNLRTRDEGKRWTKIMGGRRPLCQKIKLRTKNGI
jgi:gamma-glutamyl:cysteine ligase YbdK (ATP-grasp superfamily)